MMKLWATLSNRDSVPESLCNPVQFAASPRCLRLCNSCCCLPACFFLDIQLCPLFILHTWRRHCRAIFNWSCWMEHYVPNLLHFGQQERDTAGGDSLCNLNYRFWRARLDTGMRLNPVWFLYWVAVKKRSGLKFPLLEIALTQRWWHWLLK